MFLGLCVAALLFAGGLQNAEAGSERLAKSYYKNEKYGFKFRPMGGWTSFPPQPGEETVVVHFRTEKAERGPGWAYTPECYVYYFPKDKGSFAEYCKGKWRGCSVMEKKFIKSRKLPANSQYLVSMQAGDSKGAGFGIAYHREEYDIGVLYFCNQKSLKKKYEKLFLMSLMTFRFFEAKKKSTSSGDSDKDKLAIQKRYDYEKTRVPPGWTLVPPKRMKNFYLVYYNCEHKDANSVMTRILQIRPEFSRYYPPMNQEFVDRAAPIVRVCKTQRDFQYYSGMRNPGVLGYWSPGQEELVIFRKSQFGMSLKDLYLVLQHEGFHQFIFYACGRVSPCISLNEGGAEFFASFQKAGNKMVPTFEHSMRKGVIKGFVSSGNYKPLRTFLELTQGQHYGNSNLHYAQGWALTEFLMLGDRAPASRRRFKKEWKEIIPTYFKTLQNQVAAKERKGPEDGDKEKADNDRENFGNLDGADTRTKILKNALERALEGIDMEELEKAWCFFVKKDL
jgi:hypothetical protein